MAEGATNSERLLRSLEAFCESCAQAGIEVAVRRSGEKVGSGAERRKQESAEARWLAGEMLARQGIHNAAIARHEKGFPVWPRGWVGSLSHSSGWVAAIQGSGAVLRGVGVDIESPTRMKPAMWAHIMTAGERETLAVFDQAEAALHATAVFGAKEALFKTLSPAGVAIPGFLEVEIVWQGAGRFEARCPGATVFGVGATFDTMVVAAAWWPAD
jgi:4'-phosphopantetheinyl transferase EntD